LHLMVDPVEPDPRIFERINAKLATTPQAEPVAGKLPDLPAGPDTATPMTPPEPAALAAPEPQPPVFGAGEGEASQAPEGPASDETPTPVAVPLPPEPATDGATAVDPSPVREIGPAPVLEIRPAWRDEWREPEVQIDVIRSRRRWRALGIFMTLVVMALAGLVAAWRIVPDRVPPALRPARVMMAIGIEPGLAVPQPPPPRQAPPESQFDE
jgi:hypothetical protein